MNRDPIFLKESESHEHFKTYLLPVLFFFFFKNNYANFKSIALPTLPTQTECGGVAFKRSFVSLTMTEELF